MCVVGMGRLRALSSAFALTCLCAPHGMNYAYREKRKWSKQHVAAS